MYLPQQIIIHLIQVIFNCSIMTCTYVFHLISTLSTNSSYNFTIKVPVLTLVQDLLLHDHIDNRGTFITFKNVFELA